MKIFVEKIQLINNLRIKLHLSTIIIYKKIEFYFVFNKSLNYQICYIDTFWINFLIYTSNI